MYVIEILVLIKWVNETSLCLRVFRVAMMIKSHENAKCIQSLSFFFCSKWEVKWLRFVSMFFVRFLPSWKNYLNTLSSCTDADLYCMLWSIF